jgi:flavin reductase (DIM6/NTAB) family NADH-FMN oxidoreductase RutF
VAKYVGEKMPVQCIEALDGRNLERKFGRGYIVITVDANGAPRPCMLSAGEMLAIDERTVRIALWKDTHTARNLRRGSPIVICYVAPNSVFYLKGRPAAVLTPSNEPPVERFEIAIEAVESDMHEGFPVTDGIRFTCEEHLRSKWLAHWQTGLSVLREP